jgi:hypothetical protein
MGWVGVGRGHSWDGIAFGTGESNLEIVHRPVPPKNCEVGCLDPWIQAVFLYLCPCPSTILVSKNLLNRTQIKHKLNLWHPCPHPSSTGPASLFFATSFGQRSFMVNYKLAWMWVDTAAKYLFCSATFIYNVHVSCIFVSCSELSFT